MKKKTIDQVIAFFGTQSELGKKLGVTQQSIRHWITRGHIPIRRALQIEEISGGKIRLKDILHLTNRIWRKE